MRHRHLASLRLIARFVTLATLSVLTAATQAQTFVPPRLPQVAEQVSIASEAVAAIQSLLEKGRSFELTGRWADALSCYEDALREYPQDRTLQARFDVARLHYSLEQRYDDRSFREAVRTMRPQQSLNQYADLLTKIDAHYYTNPPWQDLVRRGAQAMDIALANEEFLRDNAIRVRGQQVHQLRAEIAQLPGRYAIRSSRDTSAIATQIARLANQRIGLSETVTYLEFTAAAAGGLDHYSAFLTADQLRDIYSQIEGNFVGLGVELKADNGDLLIVHVIPQPGREGRHPRTATASWLLTARPPAALSTDQAASLLTGAEGSLVTVSVVTPGQAARDVVVRRDHVEVPSLEDVKLVDPRNGVGYLRIVAFQKTTAADLENALWESASPGHAQPCHRPARQPGRPAHLERRGGGQVYCRRRHRLHSWAQRAGELQLPRPQTGHMARATGRDDRRR